MEHFSRRDFHQASMRDIAKDAGVAYATIYKYYGSKEQLLFTFVDEWLGEMINRMVDHLKGIETIKEKLRKLLWIQFDYYELNPKFGTIIFMTIPMKTWINDKTFHQRSLTDILMRVLHDGQVSGILNSNVKPRFLLDFMHGVVFRAFSMWIYRGKKYSLEEESNIWFDLMWQGISNPTVISGKIER